MGSKTLGNEDRREHGRRGQPCQRRDPRSQEELRGEIRGKTHPVKRVRNFCGHDYRIHGEKTIPFVKNSQQPGIFGVPDRASLPLSSANRL
ncbi:hypothetical protein ED733_003352 [Metarhizium rileyi]|uniref:Uncharacterized protein n=1 Tax=Metarhizium rileyi (strain RCEF 4871) TaxID=1649241 RepID=A0A5C6G957_METRR|nr:hypothetical protein ED733_003352 [Metarhizium rileyi]